MNPEDSNKLFQQLGSLQTKVDSLQGDVGEIKVFVLTQKLQYAKLSGWLAGSSAVVTLLFWIINHLK